MTLQRIFKADFSDFPILVLDYMFYVSSATIALFDFVSGEDFF